MHLTFSQKIRKFIMKKKILLAISILSTSVLATSFAPSNVPPMVDTINRLEHLPKNPSVSSQEDILKDLIAKYKAGHITSDPRDPGRPDALKGCVTHTTTTCTGEGKDRTCTSTSWDVCISDD